MKLFIYFLTGLLLLTSCSNNKPGAAKDTTIKTLPNSKIYALLDDSKKTNPSSAISQLVQKVLQNINSPEPLYDLAYAHLQKSHSSSNNHERDLAITYFNEVLLMVPGNQAVIQALYNIYYDDTLHNRNSLAFAKATEYFFQLPEIARTKMNPPSLARYVATGINQESHKQPDRQTLREILLQAIHEQPKNDYAYIQIAKIYSDDRYFSLALATLKLGAENISDSIELYKAIASTHENRANINNCNYEHPDDIANATKYYKLAIPLQPDNSLLHYNLSNALLDQNLNYLGLNESDLSLTLDPNTTNLSISAQNYSMLGHSKKANDLIGQALKNGLSISDLSYHEITMNKGDWESAATGFEAYIKTKETYSLYDLMKSDIITQQLTKQISNHSLAKQGSWIAHKKISLASEWEENLYKYWTKKINADDLKKVALNKCEKTEYYFYTGYQDYQSGNVNQAKRKFSEALKQNTYRFIERPLARYFLQQ